MSATYAYHILDTFVPSVFNHAFLHREGFVSCAFAFEEDAMNHWRSLDAHHLPDVCWFQRDHNGAWIFGDRPSWLS